MAGFFKGIAKGFLYVLFFPFGLIAIVLYAVFGLFVFLIQSIIFVIYFFRGHSRMELDEDIEVKKIIEKNKPKDDEEEKEEEEKPSISLYPSDSIVYGSGYTSPVVEKKPEQETEESDVEAEDDVEVDNEVEKEEEDDIA